MTDKALMGQLSSLTRAIKENTGLLGKLLQAQMETQAMLLDMLVEQPAEPDPDAEATHYLNGQPVN